METRKRREKEMKSMMSGALFGGGLNTALARVLDSLDDLDAAFRYLIGWSGRTVLGLEPGQRLDRWGATVRLSERVERDPELREAFLRNPRYLGVLAIQEAMGISVIDLLWQIRSVSVFQEEPGLHWLTLPACHHGCEVVGGGEPVSSCGSCHVCGKPDGPPSACHPVTTLGTTVLDRIHAVDEYLAQVAETDPAGRARILENPTEAFAQVTQKLFGTRPEEEFGIHEVKVVPAAESFEPFLLLARHEPKKKAAANGKAQPLPVAVG